MAKKQKRKWSHFATEDGEKSKSAKVDGYQFGDRLLEGVMFIITVQDDGTLKAEVEEDAKVYMADLNEKKWLKAALQEAEDTDIFYGANNEAEEYCLYDTEGKLNFNNGQPPIQPIVIQGTSLKDIFGTKK